MKYLLILNRFDIDKKILKTKIGDFIEDFGIVTENSKALNINEVDKAYILSSDWEVLDYKKFNSKILDAYKLVSGDSFFVKTKFFSKIPISSKSIIKKINSLMKKENISFKEQGEIEYLIQFKKDNGVYYRVLIRKNMLKETKDYSKFIVILEEPGSVIEISDFLRICWIFKIPLIIISKKTNKIDYLINKAKKMTKGIPYEKFDLKIESKIPNGFTKIGFSIKAKNSETELSKLNDKNKIALIFGDEKFGLTQKTRDGCDYLIKLAPDIKKPLRASHALSYVLGHYSNRKA